MRQLGDQTAEQGGVFTIARRVGGIERRAPGFTKCRGRLEEGSKVYVEALRVVGGNWGIQRARTRSAALGRRRRHACRPLLQLKNLNEKHLDVNNSVMKPSVL